MSALKTFVVTFLRLVKQLAIVIFCPLISSKKFFASSQGLPNASLNILLNGPSLKGSLLSSDIGLLRSDNLVVNHFADTEWYEKIKPRFYVMNDQYFWLDDVLPFYDDKRQATFQKILSITSWPLFVFVPTHFVGQAVKVFQENNFIRVQGYTGHGSTIFNPFLPIFLSRFFL